MEQKCKAEQGLLEESNQPYQSAPLVRGTGVLSQPIFIFMWKHLH